MGEDWAYHFLVQMVVVDEGGGKRDLTRPCCESKSAIYEMLYAACKERCPHAIHVEMCLFAFFPKICLFWGRGKKRHRPFKRRLLSLAFRLLPSVRLAPRVHVPLQEKMQS